MAKFTKGSDAAREAGRKGALATNAKKKLTGYKPPVTVAPINTYYMLCIDASSSMGGHEGNVEKTVQQQLDLIALNKVGNVFVSIYTFDSHVERLYYKSDATKVSFRGYRTGGMTALYDSIGQAINDHTGFEGRGAKDAAILLVITDGEENSSRTYRTPESISELIKKVQGTDRWTIAAFVPPGDTGSMTRLGIPAGNVKEWERNAKGFQDVQVTNAASTDAYTTMRSSGITKSTSYFAPNLAKLKDSTVAKKLTDRSKDFKSWTVDKEVDIKTFVEDKGVPFVLGAGYYPLTKNEKKVQKNKQIVLVKKGTREIYAGAEARELLGLPDEDTKVEPGNHGDWDIYIQSTSVNRKLVRGTKLLYNLTHTVDSKPTWEHKPTT